MHASTPQPMRFPSFKHRVLSRHISSPSSTGADAGPSHTGGSSSAPAQQPLQSEQYQNYPPTAVPLGVPVASRVVTAPTPSAAATSISNDTATQPPRLLTLPEELKAHVLSLLPAREVASSCRAVCSELRDFVDRHENLIVRLAIKQKHADLQHRINILTQMKPHDLASFVSAFCYWVDERGLRQYTDYGTYKPFTEWVNLMSGNDEHQQHQAITRWQRLTEWLVRLQCKIVRSPVKAHAAILHEAISRVKPGDSDHAQYADLCNRITRQCSSQPLVWVKQLYVKGRGAMYRTYPVLRLTGAKVKRTSRNQLEPFYSLGLVAQLALPPLPDARFCYYVEEKWCRKGLDTGAMLSPLAKAALLEVVKIY